MSEERSAAIADLERRVERLEGAVEPVPKLVAAKHTHGNRLQEHAGHFDALLGPRDSLLTKVGKMEGTILLMGKEIESIGRTVATIQDDMGKILESHELQKAHIMGQWQLRAATATAVMAAISAIIVAAMQFF